MPATPTNSDKGGPAHKQAKYNTSKGGEPLLTDPGHDDKEGQEEGGEHDVDREGLDVGDDRGAVGLGVQGGAAIVAEQVKPASSHLEI